MSQDFELDREHILGSGLGELDRAALLHLGRRLCRALEERDGALHGAVHSANISLSPQGEVGLGDASDGSAEWTPERLEFMAPELFWDKKGSAASDIYSIGLLLFAGVNGGRIPFLTPGEGEATPEQRAAAVRRRMSGDTCEVPPRAGEVLGGIIGKCLAFSPEDRYEDASELLAALQDCPAEEQAAAAPVVTAPAKVEQAEAAAPAAAPDLSYKVDKEFEEHVPPKPKRSKKPVIITFCIAAALIVLALAIWAFGGDRLGGNIATVPPTQELDAVSGVGKETPLPEGTTAPGATATPSPTEEPTPTPTATPTPTPSPTPAKESTYELYIADVSWTDAQKKCEELGGHLVTISDEAELKKVTDLADAYGIKLIWIGLYREVNGELCWVTGETIDYYIWGSGEPSKTDKDGTAENYGLLWNLKGSWIYNDSRNDPVTYYPAGYSGKIAYVCEYDS